MYQDGLSLAYFFETLKKAVVDSVDRVRNIFWNPLGHVGNETLLGTWNKKLLYSVDLSWIQRYIFSGVC